MIATIITIIIETFLMLGLILCIAYCSAYISLTSTSLDKGKFRFYINSQLFINYYFRCYCCTFSINCCCYIDYIL